jgi:phosphatidylglycerol:prolipoprotein diacylglycerol transferase
LRRNWGPYMLDTFPIVFSLVSLVCLAWLGMIEASPTSLVDVATLKTITPGRRIDAGVSCLAGGLIGARVDFCASHLSYFRLHPFEALAVWQGGLAWAGAAVGSVLALATFCGLTGLNFRRVADLLAVPAVALAFAAWLGCQIDGCAYGFHIEPAWWATSAPDWLGLVVPRWPTQMIGALACLALFAGVYRAASTPWFRARPGELAASAAAGLAAIAAGLSFTRADPATQIQGLRLDSLESLALLLMALAAFVYGSRTA